MKRVFHVKEDNIIRKSFEDLLDAERTLYSARCPEIVNEMDDTPSLWLSLQPPYAPGKSSVSCPLKPSDPAPLKHSTMPP